ncbi:MAG: PepSY domain-containing protein [Eubacteriales bacterium]|nr:PepSY domain-containing protein [Eubacteriales bacterium]
MNNRELEKRITAAYGHIAPDNAYPVLPDRIIKKGQVIVMQEKKKNNHFIKYIAELAAALMLIFGGVSFYQGKIAIASTIMLDVNPSIEIRLNRSEQVLSVLPLNEDAKVVVGDMDFSGSSLDVTVNALIGSMLRNGYISDIANSILVSVDSDDPADGQAIQTKLMTKIDAILESGNVSGAVLGQTVTNDEEILRLAEQYGITSGKAKLIWQITQQNTLYSFADLVSLSINELNLISESGGTKLENIDSIGTASSSGYIGEQAAKDVAFSHSGVSEGDAARIKCELDWEKGMMVYEVDFDADGFEYEYDINAKTGDILKHGKEKDDDLLELSRQQEKKSSGKNASAPAQGYIEEDEALSAALAHADIKESDVYFFFCEPDRDHGILVYEVEFKANGFEYDYDINAETGEVVKYSREKDDDFSEKKAAKASKAEKKQAGAKTAGAAAEDIGEVAAKEAALNHADVSEIRGYECERDLERGKTVYEISFKADGFEYEYEIDASDGSILKSEKERD